MTREEAADIASYLRRQARKGRLAAELIQHPVLTLEGVSEVERMLDRCAPHISPDGLVVLSFLKTALGAELAKASSARQRGRAQLVRWLFEQYYRPKGYSARRAATEISGAAKEIRMAEDYPAEPYRSVKRIVALNGNKVPSFGTIKKDLCGN